MLGAREAKRPVISLTDASESTDQWLTTSARERSRREIAAYIAEGSIRPEQGERLMKAEVDGLANRAA